MLHKVLGKKYLRSECSSRPLGFGVDNAGSHACAGTLQILMTLPVQLSGLQVSG